MRVDIDKEEVLFESTGRVLGANMLIIGMAVDGNGVSDGADGTNDWPGLTVVERHELAIFMIQAWAHWAADGKVGLTRKLCADEEVEDRAEPTEDGGGVHG